MSKYKEYRKTEIPWLNALPSHWEEKRAKYLFNKENRQPSDDDEVITCFRDGVVTLRKNRRTTGFTESLKEIGYQGIKKGDLVIHQMDAFAGATGVSDCDGKGTPVYSVCTPKDYRLLTKYYAKVIRYMGLNGFIQSLYRGIRERSSDFRFETFARQLLPLPPLAEQEKIVRFLESKTLCIDAYVAERERELQLLNELKESEIANIVTRGLNPDVKMKDSGIPWIGMIPEHWDVKRIASLFTGKVAINSDFKYQHAYKFNYGTLVPKDEVGDIEEYRATYVKYSIIKKGDILINGLNLNYDFVSQRVAIAPNDGIITSAYIVARPRLNTNSEYYNYLFKTMDNKKLFHGMGTGIRLTLSFDELKKQLIPVPSPKEQYEIVAYIEEKCKKVNSLIDELNAEIEYLKEYKQKLIADCVTGQINVQSEI